MIWNTLCQIAITISLLVIPFHLAVAGQFTIYSGGGAEQITASEPRNTGEMKEKWTRKYDHPGQQGEEGVRDMQEKLTGEVVKRQQGKVTEAAPKKPFPGDLR